MSVCKITDNVYSIGVLNPSLRVFDIIMETKYGTTYNAYFVQGGEKSALVETVHAKYFDEYIENIASITDVSKIDYLILNHTEPDHTGSVERLLALNPNIEVIATAAGMKVRRRDREPGIKGKNRKAGRHTRPGRENAYVYPLAVFALAGLDVYVSAGGQGPVFVRHVRLPLLRAAHV